MWKIMAFFLGALIIVALSWRVFEDVRSHGFSRFLAFLTIWALIVINVPSWFQDPFSVRQVLSWIMLVGSILLAVTGFRLLRGAGRVLSQGPSTDFAFEQTKQLVTTGPYRYIRHPLYASLILLAWGSALKGGSLWSVFLGMLATGFLYLTARNEEEENLGRFGESYADYMTRTRMFVPGVF